MKEFLQGYVDELRLIQTGSGFDFEIPFKFFNDDKKIKLHIEKNKKGFYDIDDKGETLNYLSNIDANLLDYEDKVEIICNLFSLKIERGLVKGIIGYGNGRLYLQMHNFLQGLSHLSTIKYLS